MRKSKKRIRSNLRKVDAHVLTKEELDEAPPFTKEEFKRALVQHGGVPDVRKIGRPLAGSAPKQPVTIRLDKEVIDHFKDQGAGWQTKINQSLRKSAGLDRRK